MSELSAQYENDWAKLRGETPARLDLGRTGVSLPTARHLDFQLAHARARDAVHAILTPAALIEALAARGLSALALHSAAPDRATYLRRPDLGRALDLASRRQMHDVSGGPFELGFVIADGLSAAAVNAQAVELIAQTVALRADRGWRIAPTCLVEQGRVAIGDEIGRALGVSLAIVLIGERPGLSAPHSLGVYATWSPAVGTVDAGRNCISNIHAGGLRIADAAVTLAALIDGAMRHRCTGVALGAAMRAERPAIGPSATMDRA
jgi:ethanolamine ammonia-lyase small subunit